LQDLSPVKKPRFPKYGNILIFSTGVDIISGGEIFGIPGLTKEARAGPGIVLLFRMRGT
jgi:hypothetical protein